jgi:rubredoxin
MKIIVKNRSGHDMSHMGPYLKSFLPYAQKRMGFNRPPTIFFDSDPQNAENVLGKTAYYNPETEEIVVFVDKRHPKDILRSLSHELVHHSQNCRGDLDPEIAGETTPGYAQTNAHMRAMEGEAYLKGNGYYFRDWEDSLKNGLEETNYKHITGDTHKMANYDQLKEEITAKVVAALTEKLKGDQHEIASAAPPEDEITGADFKALQKKKSVEEVNEEEEIEERKKRNTPRDSNRREPEKLKMNEEREKSLKDAMIAAARTSEEKKKRLQREMEKELDRQNIPQMSDADRAMALYYWSQQEDGPPLEEGEEEQLEENHCGGKRHDDLEAGMRCPMCGHIVMAEAEELEEAQEELEEVQEEEVVEETISNDEWYQSELFESLKKRWTK